MATQQQQAEYPVPDGFGGAKIEGDGSTLAEIKTILDDSDATRKRARDETAECNPIFPGNMVVEDASAKMNATPSNGLSQPTDPNHQVSNLSVPNCSAVPCQTLDGTPSEQINAAHQDGRADSERTLPEAAQALQQQSSIARAPIAVPQGQYRAPTEYFMRPAVPVTYPYQQQQNRPPIPAAIAQEPIQLPSSCKPGAMPVVPGTQQQNQQQHAQYLMQMHHFAQQQQQQQAQQQAMLQNVANQPQEYPQQHTALATAYPPSSQELLPQLLMQRTENGNGTQAPKPMVTATATPASEGAVGENSGQPLKIAKAQPVCQQILTAAATTQTNCHVVEGCASEMLLLQSLNSQTRVRCAPMGSVGRFSSQKLWIKYGQKKVQRCSPDATGVMMRVGCVKRSYYKCYNKDCSAKMYVDVDGETAEEAPAVLSGGHTHAFEIAMEDDDNILLQALKKQKIVGPTITSTPPTVAMTVATAVAPVVTTGAIAVPAVAAVKPAGTV